MNRSDELILLISGKTKRGCPISRDGLFLFMDFSQGVRGLLSEWVKTDIKFDKIGYAKNKVKQGSV
jgi:hypothetical protein